METNKNYFAQLLNDRRNNDAYETLLAFTNGNDYLLNSQSHYFFVYEVSDVASDVHIECADGTYKLQHYLQRYKASLLSADIAAIRFFGKGISVVRRSKMLSKHESNPWHAVFAMLNSADVMCQATIKDFEYGNDVSAASNSALHAAIDTAFDTTGVIMKPAKVAKLLGASDSEAESFDDAYATAFNESTDGYTFEIENGSSVVAAYLTRNYASWNSSPLYGSCMNDKRNIVKWYERNKKHVSIAVLRDSNGSIVARAIVWLDATISEWGNDDTQSACFGNKVYYTGKFVDRIYHHNNDARRVMYVFLRNSGYAFKKCQCYGEGFVTIPNGNSMQTIYSDRLLIVTRVSVTTGKLPYLDTLSYVSDSKHIANRPVEGDIKRAVSTRGDAEYDGEYIKCTIGVVEGAQYAVRKLGNSQNAQRVLLPDGRMVGVLSNALGATIRQSAYTDTKHYVVQSMARLAEVNLPVYDNEGNYVSKEALQVYCYPNQLTYDAAAKDWIVASLYCSIKQEFVPVHNFCILVDRNWNKHLTNKAKSRSKAAKALSTTTNN